MRIRHWVHPGALFLLLFVNIACAVTLTDDRGRKITPGLPPARIVSLAPHVTELLYAIGAGDMLVGADEYSNYPVAAAQLPRVGNASRVDIDRVLSLEPAG
jgi:iron complex transport system substrate-binding protein